MLYCFSAISHALLHTISHPGLTLTKKKCHIACYIACRCDIVYDIACDIVYDIPMMLYYQDIICNVVYDKFSPVVFCACCRCCQAPASLAPRALFKFAVCITEVQIDDLDAPL